MMKVETNQTGSGTYTLKVEVSAKRVDQKSKAIFRRMAQEVVFPGFRRGKAPRSLLEQQLGKDFLDEDVQNGLIEEALPEALEQEALRPVSRPETRVVEFALGKPFVFEADIEVLPEITFPEFASVNVEALPAPATTDADVDKAIEGLKVQNATLLPKDEGQAAAFQDVAIVEIGDGKPRELLLSEDSKLAEQLVGHTAGETVEVMLNEQAYPLKLVELKTLDKPDLEELASVMEHDDEATLIAEVKTQLQQRLELDHKQQTRFKALDAVIEQSDVPVPPRLKEEVIQYELEALERSERVGALDDEDRSAYSEGAEQRLKRDVALEALKRQIPSLKLDDEAFEALLKEEAQLQDINAVKFKALLEREGSLGRFRSQKEDERALDFLVEQVRWTESEGKKEAAKTAVKAKKASAKKTTEERPS